MGTDIHVVFQKKQGFKWVDVLHRYEGGRHYKLFAWLADVRNGYGFAGVPTHEVLKPVSPPRGLPTDFEVEGARHPVDLKTVPVKERKWFTKYPDEYPSGYYIYMGDHSFSWLLGSEILSAPLPRVMDTGVVERAWFEQWDGVTGPESYSGMITGQGVHVSDMTNVGPATTHVQIRWFSECADEFKYFLDEVRRLVKLHGEVRMVFGFDS